MNPVDFKKKDKSLYYPPLEPVLVQVPDMKFIMADGWGDPNDSEIFQQAVEMVYALSYQIRMSPRRGEEPAGYYPYVVPPLEGLWDIKGDHFRFDQRDNWIWTIMIRQPEFVTEEVFLSAAESASAKKKWKDIRKHNLRLETYREGLAVQIMHVGDYESEPESVEKIVQFCQREGLQDCVGDGGKHHEIYLSDPRKVEPDRRKTVLRHPVRMVEDQ